MEKIHIFLHPLLQLLSVGTLAIKTKNVFCTCLLNILIRSCRSCKGEHFQMVVCGDLVFGAVSQVVI